MSNLLSTFDMKQPSVQTFRRVHLLHIILYHFHNNQVKNNLYHIVIYWVCKLCIYMSNKRLRDVVLLGCIFFTNFFVLIKRIFTKSESNFNVIVVNFFKTFVSLARLFCQYISNWNDAIANLIIFREIIIQHCITT